jgi:2-polyprenyl-3-methyl-5-hydroxy-6-metoxy-1,4-benzoquinol methylase
MYTPEMWNQIYRDGKNITWLRDKSAIFFGNELKKYIDTSKSQKILDYGCGNGKIGMSFKRPNISVELADISDEQIAKINKEFSGQIQTYAVSYPNEIKNKYDCIICCNVFHHLEPKEWGVFLQQFYDLLNPKGRLLISGFDKTDAIFQSNDDVAPMAKHKVWSINRLIDTINPKQFKILDTYTNQLEHDMVAQENKHIFIFRFIMLERS